jgi:SAM-dependent methyltransferase
MAAEGWKGWDDYARFYDWENARTMGRRDVRFWQAFARREGGPVLELGCGTGRVAVPVARTGVPVFGIDRSEPMLSYARRRSRRVPPGSRPVLVRGDIRALPFGDACFSAVMAPYGILQSLTRERDLRAALSEATRVLRSGGALGVDLVPDLPAWDEYHRRTRLRGRAGRSGRRVTLVESVRQDRRRKLTIFDQEYVEIRDGERVPHRFSLTFRTLPLPQMVRRLEDARLASPGIAVSWPSEARKKKTAQAMGGAMTLPSPRRGVVQFPLHFPFCFLGVAPCPAIPSGIRSNTRREPPTPSAAASSPGSSRS